MMQPISRAPLSYRFSIFLLLLGIILLGSWICPWTRPFWDQLDQWALQWNRSLATRPQQQYFWAMANYRKTELILIGLIACGYLGWIFSARGALLKQRLVNSLYTLILVFGGAFFCKVGVANILRALGFLRWSPSMVEDGIVHLGKAVPDLYIKVGSSESFPGDHATVSLLWASAICFFYGRRMGLCAFLGALCWSLPRLAGATHWLTDCLVGSLGITVIILPIWLAPPIYSRLMPLLEKLISLKKAPLASDTYHSSSSSQ